MPLPFQLKALATQLATAKPQSDEQRGLARELAGLDRALEIIEGLGGIGVGTSYGDVDAGVGIDRCPCCGRKF